MTINRIESRSSLFSLWLRDLNQSAEQRWNVSLFDLIGRDYDWCADFEEGTTVSQMFERVREWVEEGQQ